jgi:Phage integrase family
LPDVVAAGLAGSQARDGTDALPGLRPPDWLDGAAGALGGVEGCRIAGAAPGGGGAATAEPEAEAGLGRPAEERLAAGDGWQHTGLVFTTHRGAALDAGNVRKMFKRICTEAGIGDSWTPRELRTSFVSLLSHRGVSIEEIARLVGHATTRTTEVVYRRELRPIITTGAEIMDQLFTAT